MNPLESELRSGIDTSLRLRIEENAIFLAERLFTEFPSQSSLLKVAECYRAAGDSATALRLLRHHQPFTMLPAETLRQEQVHPQRGHVLIAGSFRWKLLYLHGVLAARTHQYGEAERILQQLVGCPRNNNNNNVGDSSSNKNSATNDSSGSASSLDEDEAAVRYWLGLCGSYQGEAARNKPSNLFLQCASNVPLFFCAFEEAVRRSDSLQDTAQHVYNSNSTSFSSSSSSAATSSSSSSFSSPDSKWFNLIQFLQPFAEVTRLLYGGFECDGALSILQNKKNNNNNNNEQSSNQEISIYQRVSGWVLEHTAMSYFHSGRTQDAIACFEQLRQREPWRLNTPAMVYFSTCLWHSKQEVALCSLAQKMIDAIPKSPFTLSVVGNCHSLNRDSRTAATMFHRATCLDPKFAYAHTLRGHELLAVEEVSDAETAFYEALKWDKRHYAAYAGLGETYFRLEKEGPARENFRSALKINGTLPAVLCRLAATYHRLGATASDLEVALSLYEASLQRCPTHLPSQQQRASILVRIGRLSEAQDMLAKLISDCPEEPSLHVAFGKCMAKLGNQDAAIRSFHKAMDLDPRRQASVRVLLDRVAAKKDVDVVLD